MNSKHNGNFRTTNDYYEFVDYEHVLENLPAPLKNYLAAEEKFIRKYIKKGDFVIDVGCGYGRMLSVLGKNSRETVGIDYSFLQIAKARKVADELNNVRVAIMDASKMQFEENSFDKVLCLGHTFGNFEDMELKILAEMRRIARPSGEICLSVINEKAREAHEQFYRKNNLRIAENSEGYIRLSDGLYSRRFSREDVYLLAKESAMKSCSIVDLTDISFLVFCKK